MSDEPDIRITGEAGDAPTALAMIRAHDCDVVLMDINLGARNGLETLSAIRAEKPRLPVDKRSFFGAFPQVGVPIGMILATTVLLILTTALGKERFIELDRQRHH